MQSASRKGLLDIEYTLSRREKAWEKTREWMGGGRLGAVILVLLLTITIARSTATVGWVDGLDVVAWIAIGGAVLMGLFAVLPVAEPIALSVGLVLAPVVAIAGAWPQIHARHHEDVLSLGLFSTWWQRISDGSAGSDPSFYLALICLLMWIAGGWLAWCVLRWRKPMLGLIPGAAAFATNVLNLPDQQNGYTLAILVFTLALLLWTNYTGSIASAIRANVKLSGDARWDFWESGLVATAALIVLGIMLPPLSTTDRTLDVESGIFTNWAQLQQQLSHPGFFTSGGGTGITGFSDDVKLAGALNRTRDVVFTYTVVGDYASARYFRGLSETVTQQGEWRYANSSGVRVALAKNQPPAYAETDQKRGAAGFNIKMVRPPIGNNDLLFYPGQLYKADRTTLAGQVPLNAAVGPNLLYSVDRLGSVQPPSSIGPYSVTVEYSTATVADLQNAGTAYPAWVGQFSSLPKFGYRSPDVEDAIHNLALDIIRSAGATTPYDEAAAIESYLRNPVNYTYDLHPPRPTDGQDPLSYFLFVSKRGYCEFFASAMGDMLRSLGIPTRLVNGFGPGSFDTPSGVFVVRGEDAHTWVEVYFPAPAGSTQPYGWIPFEPTADGVYNPIQRGVTGGNVCITDQGCNVDQVGGSGGTTPSPRVRGGIGGLDPGNGPTSTGFRVGGLDATGITRVAAVVIAILLLLLVAGSRYLRPRTVMAVWRRMLVLARLAGAGRPPGETPLEIGRRLQRAFPEAAEPVGALASGFVVAAYAPPDTAATSRSSVMEAWAVLRPMLLRRVLARLRPTRP